ncbi:hypothetical protein FF1_032157 [Malus domestica]
MQTREKPPTRSLLRTRGCPPLRMISTMSSHMNRTLTPTPVHEGSLFGEIVPVMVDLDLSWSNRGELRNRRIAGWVESDRELKRTSV